MSIKAFIQEEVLAPRLEKRQVLVVYDPDRRYRNLCLELASDKIVVIDACESSITSRADAMDALVRLGRHEIEQLLVYVPTTKSLRDDEKQNDPFALYAVCGSVFPDGDGDSYLSICLRAKPDHPTQVRAVFEQNPKPPFEVIDAIGAGLNWPNLRSLLELESTQDIILAIMAPSKSEKTVLDDKHDWLAEAKELFSVCLGLTLDDQKTDWDSVSAQLWRFVLFSEFVFDLPVELPDALSSVPVAIEAAKPLINEIGDRLRNDQRTMSQYIDRAGEVERELDLSKQCANLKDLGLIDTFPFEERHFIEKAIQALSKDDIDGLRSILKGHAHTVWSGTAESQAQWGLIQSALSLCEVCDDLERQLPIHSRDINALIDYYLNHFREVDRCHREFELAVNDCLDAVTYLSRVVSLSRDRYRKITTTVQELFIRYLADTGWPPGTLLANADVFDKIVAPKLKVSGCRVAFFQVDALRYELGVALANQLSEDNQTDLQAAYASLPSITSVGMASLLPGAGKNMSLQKHKKKVVPVLNGSKLIDVNARMEVLKKVVGARFLDVTLGDFLKRKKEIESTVELLVIRSVEIDAQMETDPETALRVVHDTLKRIRIAIHKLNTLGFSEVVIATDHGFYFNTQLEAGDVCAKPSGEWITAHQRFLLGNGADDSANFTMTTGKLGIRGDFIKAATPKGLVSYRTGESYFHGGISLQECLVPVLTIKLRPSKTEVVEARIVLTYKEGAKRITTRLPVLSLSWDNSQFSFGDGFDELELLLEAYAKGNKLVGVANAGNVINPTTGTIILKKGESIQVPIRMDLEFEGEFSVKVMNPTTLSTYYKLDLETDYTV
jgi:hypothetical protein